MHAWPATAMEEVHPPGHCVDVAVQVSQAGEGVACAHYGTRTVTRGRCHGAAGSACW